MKLVHRSADLAAMAARGTRAVVMTMGALHDGHLSLVHAAREVADQVVVTIFVNPLQFNDPGDLERYPRTLEADCALLEAAGVDMVYAPDTEDVYPGGAPVVTVRAGAVGEHFEGVHRPGHFDGMLTVVLKLLHLTRPDLAVFGAKDAQQLMAIRAMVRDLNVPVQIVESPTVRESDGLAMSSRNRFLSEEDRLAALALPRALEAARQQAEDGGDLARVLRAGREVLSEQPAVTVDYFAALDPVSAAPAEDDYCGEVVLAVAATVGTTRLIDNVRTTLGG